MQVGRKSVIDFKGGELSFSVVITDVDGIPSGTSDDIADSVMARLMSCSASSVVPDIKKFFELIGEYMDERDGTDEPSPLAGAKASCEVLGRSLELTVEVMPSGQKLDKNLLAATLAVHLAPQAFQLFAELVTKEAFEAAADVSGLRAAFDAQSPLGRMFASFGIG